MTEGTPRPTRAPSGSSTREAETSAEDSLALAAAAVVIDNSAALRAATVPADTEPPTIFVP